MDHLTHYLKFIFSCFFVVVSQWANALDTHQLLPSDQAFKVSAVVTKANHIKVSWLIADGYYLSHKKIAFSSKTDSIIIIQQADLPTGEIKKDKNFDDIQIYRHAASRLLTLKRPATALPFFLLVKYQGCADSGFCYPLQQTILKIALPAINKPQSSDTLNLKPLSNKLNLRLSRFSSADKLLSADKAFQFFATIKDERTLNLQWRIAEGYYLYREKFALQLSASTGTKLLDYVIPHGKAKHDEVFGDVELLYKDISFDVPLMRSKLAAQNITLIASFQGCAERGVCYPPMQQSINLLLPAIATVAIANTGDLAQKTPVTEQGLIVESLQQDSFLLTLLSFLGFGLLLAFTPCVFPMIPILSGIIVGQGKGITQRKAFFLSLSFVLASAIAYTVFGVLAALFGSNLQASFQAPSIIYLFSGIFVALSLSMFGLYTLQLPKFLQSSLHNASNKHRDGSFIGAALMGLFSALIVGPCVAAPLAAALIYIGQTGDVILGGSALFVMGFGMGIPLLIIGTSMGRLLPKAGNWLNVSKAVFGIIMLAVAIWMLERVIAAQISMLFWAMLCIIPAIYLRVLDPLPEIDSGWHKLWKGFGVLLFAYGLLILIGLSAGNTNPLQPLHGLSPNVSSQQQQTPIAFKRITSLAELNQQLQVASTQGKWVMLDFYADWCISCKEMEAYTLSNPKVKQALSGFIILQADITANNQQDKALLKAFNLIGPPAILFFNLDGQEQSNARVIGYQPADVFLQHLTALVALSSALPNRFEAAIRHYYKSHNNKSITT